MPFIEITVTVPKSIINTDKVRQAIIDAQGTKTGPKLQQEFKKTVQGWVKHRPGFYQRRDIGADHIGIIVHVGGQNADIYALLNTGAQRHRITPRRTTWLRFQTGYRAGSTPRVLTTRRALRFGKFVQAEGVNHPGFEAREFAETIAKNHAPEFAQDMQEAIQKGTH